MLEDNKESGKILKKKTRNKSKNNNKYNVSVNEHQL